MRDFNFAYQLVIAHVSPKIGCFKSPKIAQQLSGPSRTYIPVSLRFASSLHRS